MPIPQSTRGSNLDYRSPDRRVPKTAVRSPPDPPPDPPPPPSGADSDESGDEADGGGPAPNRRRILLNQTQRGRFISNHVTTSKYNLLSFLPKFLFEQFRRYANVFFLCIGLLQQIPNVSPTGKYVTLAPFGFILMLTAIKELIEDYKRHKADDRVNAAPIQVLNREGGWDMKPWQAVVVGDIVKVENGKFFPADLILLASSEPQAMCYIETANLDGETNLKIRSGLMVTAGLDTPLKMSQFSGYIECELPNRNLYDFKGNVRLPEGVSVPISPSSVLLRGAKLMNTGWIFGVVVYSGHESKLLMNSTQAPLKRSNIDKITNYQIIFLFLILIAISLFSSAANEIQKYRQEEHWYLGNPDQLENNNFFYNFLTFIILYNNLIPISLQVTLEFVKFIQAYFINWDEEMFYAPSQTPALARTSNLNEELGQIKYIFSDKTGTLTRNIMEFKKSSIAGLLYSVSETTDETKSELLHNLLNGHETAPIINDFEVLMAVCHTVIPEIKDGAIFYNASSPDEKALVEGAARYGFEFVTRKPESVIIKTPRGTNEEYEVLNVVEFTSTRKRMTVIVRTPEGKIKLFCKGADTMIMERLGNKKEDRLHQAETNAHMEYFAREGLRTLCLAVKVIDDAVYKEWNKLYHKAETNLENKQEEIDKAAELIETDLTLLGATAIEDKLQDGVPETIAQLLEANIHVWVLTGDKQETAINIGHSCRLLKENMPIIIINSTNLDDTRNEITLQLNNFKAENAVGKDNDVAVVVDGKTLTFALDHSLRKDFLDLCCSCQSVICCRVSPIQKAEMVELVQENTGAISLAIGDGANDVAMIQKADVGVGISGNEGLQAANSSDFAIAQFRYLSRLLLVHGAWNYSRISKVILYSFYKNICLYIIELWFAFYNYWSGQVLFERWTIGLYNIFFTSWPPVAMGLFDQYCNANTRMKYPSLYHSTQRSDFFNHRVFWLWMFNSIVHSVFLFWLPVLGYQSTSVWAGGQTGGYLVLGNIVYSFVVVTVCCKAGLEMDSWSWISHMSVWGSIFVWFVFLVTYSFCWPLGIELAANMAGMAFLVLSTPLFWLGLLLIPFVTLIPDIAYKAIKVTVYTSETDKIRIAEIMKKDVAAYITGASRTGIRLSEASALLRNVRKVFSRHSPKRQKEELELAHGYAFSQEEGGAVSQVEFIRRYDTTKRASAAACQKGGKREYLMFSENAPSSRLDQHEQRGVKKSVLGGNNANSRISGFAAADEESPLISFEDCCDHASVQTKTFQQQHQKKNTTQRLTARQAELPVLQSPRKVEVKVKRMRHHGKKLE